MHVEIQPKLSEESVREEHLRFAVMLDLITDTWNDGQSVRSYVAQLRLEFDAHAAHEEQILEKAAPALLDDHREGHDSMSTLLSKLATEADSGKDIRQTLDGILHLFTRRLMPDDMVFARL